MPALPTATPRTKASPADPWSADPWSADLLTGQGNGGLNMAHEAVFRHAAGAAAERIALRRVGPDGGPAEELSYAELGRRVERFAAVLERLGVVPGERVFGLAGRRTEAYVAALGTLAHRNVFCPLFPAFGPEPVRQRLELGTGRVLVTTSALYRRKVAPQRHLLPHLRHVLVIDDRERTPPDGTVGFHRLMEETREPFTVPPTAPEDPALLHFTSGTTGTPKGAQHVHGAIAVHAFTGLHVLGLRAGDVFWCTADPGWVTGTSYGILAPLTLGVTNLIYDGPFDPAGWYRVLDEQKVEVWYTAPTALRVLMRAGTDLVRERTYPNLRHIASVGEPLDAEAVEWGRRAFGLQVHDTWWQTETGGILIANVPGVEIKPGSMGLPVPGIEALIVEPRPDDDEDRPYRPSVIEEPDEPGELAILTPWPSMFRGYLNQEERYRRCFATTADGREVYLTGDRARKDADGYFWFVGRGDDVIKTSGHLVGPFEVEAALLEHDAVAEAGVIGKPDPLAGKRIKAFVTLHRGYEPTEELGLELLGHGRKRLGSAVAPKEIDFVDGLPKTRSGKILRRLLLARELGLPEGDLSMLENGS